MRTIVTLVCMLVLVLPQTVVADSTESEGMDVRVEVSDDLELPFERCGDEIRRLAGAITANGQVAVRLVEFAECLERLTSRVCVIGGLWDLRELDELAHGLVLGLVKNYIDLIAKLYVYPDSGGKLVLPLKVDFSGTSCRSPGSYGWAWEVGEEPFPRAKVADWWDKEP